MPLPLAPQKRIGQVLEMFPALFLGIIPSPGGEQMQMGMVLPIAPMGVEHCDGATPERFAPDRAIEIIEALRPTAHECVQYHLGVVVKGRTEHRRHRQDNVPIDHPLVKDPAHLADPVVHGDFGAPQAQRRLTAHRHQVLALATVQAAVRDIAYFFRVAARQHLGHQAIVVCRLVVRMGLLKRLPVVSKDLLEDIPVPRGGCHHRIAPSGGDQIVAMERLYHAAAASSTPHPASLRYPHPTRLSLMNESFRDRKNAFSYTIKIVTSGFAQEIPCHFQNYPSRFQNYSSCDTDQVTPITSVSLAASTTSVVTRERALMSTRRAICVSSRCKRRKLPPVIRIMAARTAVSDRLCSGSVTPAGSQFSWS